MYLIVGLGNPGSKYEHTRHNIGFDVIDILSKKYNIELNRTKFKGVYGDGKIGKEKVILLKPQTYMNLSGESIRAVMDFYKISKENIIVIYDDISIDIGKIRLRKKGSAGGHNGIKNTILHLSDQTFNRIKIGVGAPEHDLVNHVLGRFSKEEWEKITKVFEAAAIGVEKIILEGMDVAMNDLNSLVF